MYSFRKWGLALLLILLATFNVFGQGTSPDCKIKFSLTGAGSTATFDNRSNFCSVWVIAYSSTGFTSSLALTVQNAPTTSTPGTPGSWATFEGTVLSGSNPNTAVTQGQTKLEGYYPFMRVTLGSLTGTGVVTGQLYGYRYVASKVSESSGGDAGSTVTVASPFWTPDAGVTFLNSDVITKGNGLTWAWVNRDGGNLSTITDTNGALTLWAPATASVNLRIRSTARPTPPYTLRTKVLINSPAVAHIRAGIGMRESGTGKIRTLASHSGANWALESWSSATAYVGSTLEIPWYTGSGAWYVTIIDSGTALTWQVSGDGFGPIPFATTEAYTVGFTTAPDQVLFFVDTNNASVPASITILSWQVS